MLTTMGHVRRLLREASRDIEEKTVDHERLRDVFEKLAQHIRDNPELTATHDSIKALNGVFSGLKPGTVPTSRDVDKQVQKILGWAMGLNDEISRRGLVDRMIRISSPGPGSVYDSLERVSLGMSKRPRSMPPEGKTWGKYIFSPHRNDVPLEPDVPEEARAYAALHKLLNGNKPLPHSIALQLQALMKAGEYQKVLRPPGRYKMFYRGMANVTSKQLSALLNVPINIHGETVNVDTTYIPKHSVSSWSVDRQTASGYTVKALGSSRSGGWSVLLIASIHDNPDSFVMNPDVIYTMGDLAGDDDHQNDDDSEVFAVGPIKLSTVSYRPAR